MKPEFEAAFDAWLASEASHIKRHSSRDIYRAIWGAFVRDLPADVNTIQSITSDMVAHYLATGASPIPGVYSKRRADQLSIGYQARVASLIEKVMHHHAKTAETQIEGDSPVTALMRKTPALANASKRETRQDPDLDFLSASEYIAMKGVLISRDLADAKAGAVVKWSDARDRTSMALQLGAGLSPSDVRELTLGEGASRSLNSSWHSGARFLFVPQNGKLLKRHTLVDDWAATLFDLWIDQLRNCKPLAQVYFVFPGEITARKQSSKQPGQWSKASQHKQTTKVMTTMGLSGSSFKLRHTWALSKLREGASTREVARWLGVQDGGEVMQRYLDALAAGGS